MVHIQTESPAMSLRGFYLPVNIQEYFQYLFTWQLIINTLRNLPKDSVTNIAQCIGFWYASYLHYDTCGQWKSNIIDMPGIHIFMSLTFDDSSALQHFDNTWCYSNWELTLLSQQPGSMQLLSSYNTDDHLPSPQNDVANIDADKCSPLFYACFGLRPS